MSKGQKSVAMEKFDSLHHRKQYLQMAKCAESQTDGCWRTWDDLYSELCSSPVWSAECDARIHRKRTLSQLGFRKAKL